MKKQLSLFLGLFLLLAIGYHIEEWIEHPYAHLMGISGGGFGLGVIHPLVFSFAVYMVVMVILWLGNMIKKIF
jgi:hypothetical protein